MSPHPSVSTQVRPADTTSSGLPLSLPHPVAALVTGRSDDVAVVDAAVRLAAPRKAPVLLVAVLSAPSRIPDRARTDAQAARVSLARVLPRLRTAGVGYIPVVHRVPADSGGQPGPRAAGGVLNLAARHHSPLVVASSRGPAGLDAHSLIEASAVRGGPFVYAVNPAGLALPATGSGLGPADLSPAGARSIWTLAQCRLPVASPEEA
ncbi:universal stress protein [Streptomyces sp. NPDC102394]|uniref:universal stress protein n=1 Tax=Streptomyces sp. NPDC102394 TaxID=3366167 RepID=UPI003807C27B